MRLTANSPGYCATRLLTDALTQQRMARLWQLLDTTPVLMVPHVGLLASAPGKPAARAVRPWPAADVDCMAAQHPAGNVLLHSCLPCPALPTPPCSAPSPGHLPCSGGGA